MNTLPGEAVTYGVITVLAGGAVAWWVRLLPMPNRPASLIPTLCTAVGALMAAAGVFLAAIVRWASDGTIDPQVAFGLRCGIAGGIAFGIVPHYIWRRG